MKIKKGTKLIVQHKRQGEFRGKAIKDFDTDKEEFYPIELDQEILCGMSDDWLKGDIVPCRNTHCKIIKLEGESK